MQEQWNYAVNTLRDVEAENEKLKEKYNAALKNNANLTELQFENEKLKKEVEGLNFYINEYKIAWEIDKLNKYKQALEVIKVDFINQSARNGLNKFENEIFIKIDEVLKRNKL